MSKSERGRAGAGEQWNPRTMGWDPARMRDVHRVAGMAAAWGASVDVKAGAPLPRFELVRASVGYPVAWACQVWIDGNPAGILPALTKISVNFQPGLGRGGSQAGQPFSIATDPVAFLTSGQGVTPATELVVIVECAVLALKPYRVCGVACPWMWTPAFGPVQG